MINREKMYNWLLSIKQKDGSFAMHRDGEPDVRATYCGLVVAKLLDILDEKLKENCADYIAKCQTYEGGFGGSPGNEAHGGYTFCGAAASWIVGCLDQINVDLLLEWVAKKQMNLEGGFCGRTNKLVDSCYSFWQGSVPVIVYNWREQKNEDSTKKASKMNVIIDEKSRVEIIEDEVPGVFPFNQIALQEYLLLCCQNPKGNLKRKQRALFLFTFQGAGGMIDKPGKHADLYHTCYALSGLSLAQNNPIGEPSILGEQTNLLRKIDPVYNVLDGMALKMNESYQIK